MVKSRFFIALLCIFICFSSYINIKATEIVIPYGMDYIDYLTLESLSLALTEGAELNWADLDLGNASLTAEEKVRKMLSYYRTKAWGYGAAGIYGITDILGTDAGDPSTSAIGIGFNSGITSENQNDLKRQLDNLALGYSNQDVYMNVKAKDVANWSNYGVEYLNTFLERINYYDNSVPIPRPDPNYSSYLNKINNRNVSDYNAFWFYNFNKQTSYNTLTSTNNAYPITNYTWAVVKSVNAGNVSNFYDATNYQKTPMCVPLALSSIYITGSGNTYSYSFSFTPNSNRFLITSNGNSNYSIFNYANNTYFYSMLYNDSLITDTITRSYSGSLDSVLNHIGGFFKNVNIYVNNELWADVGGQTIDRWNVTIPNAVTDTGTDSGKIVAAPIFWVNDEVTDNPVDEWQINLSKILDILETKVSNGETSIAMQDLVDGQAIEKDGTVIGEGTGVIAGAISLADTIAKAKTIEAVGELTLDDVISNEVPPLPALPTMGVNPGFGGVTVLARIVNVANQSLPSELIVTFWGVVFGAVILGIIKILHK